MQQNLKGGDVAMETEVVFHASFQGSCFKSDEDGESKIVMTIPASDLAAYHELTKLTKRDLIVTVREA